MAIWFIRGGINQDQVSPAAAAPAATIKEQGEWAGPIPDFRVCWQCRKPSSTRATTQGGSACYDWPIQPQFSGSTVVQGNSWRVAHALPDFDGKCARMGMASCHIYHCHIPIKHCRTCSFIRTHRTEHIDSAAVNIVQSPIKWC